MVCKRQGLGHVYDLHQHVVDRSGFEEQTLGVDVAHDVVDAFAPDEYAGEVAVDEKLGQLLDIGRFDVDRLDVDARHHAVPHAQVGEVERILEQTYVVLVVLLYFYVFGLDQTRQVVAVECRLHAACLDPAPPRRSSP